MNQASLVLRQITVLNIYLCYLRFRLSLIHNAVYYVFYVLFIIRNRSQAFAQINGPLITGQETRKCVVQVSLRLFFSFDDFTLNRFAQGLFS